MPDRAIGSDQSGRYVLVAGKDDIVEQRSVEIGQLVGTLRVVASGLKPDDRIVVSGLMSLAGEVPPLFRLVCRNSGGR